MPGYTSAKVDFYFLRTNMHITAVHTDMFATRLWTFDLSQLSPYFPVWQAALETRRKENPISAGRSNKGGWNSDLTLLTDPVFAPLLETSQSAVSYVFHQMLPGRELQFRLEAWANIHDPGAFNERHLHPNVLLSACFYLAVPPGSGAISFHDPRPAVVASVFQGAGINTHQKAYIEPHEGMLVLFPNWLEHSVEPHEGQAPRISIAMNAVSPFQ